VPADSAAAVVKFTISIPSKSCTNAKAKYSSSVVPPDPSVHFCHCIRVTNIQKSFTHKMAAETSWHRYITKFRHCHPVYRKPVTYLRRKLHEDRLVEYAGVVPGRFVPMQFRSRERNCLVTFVLVNCRLLQLSLYWGVGLLGTPCTIMNFLTMTIAYV